MRESTITRRLSFMEESTCKALIPVQLMSVDSVLLHALENACIVRKRVNFDDSFLYSSKVPAYTSGLSIFSASLVETFLWLCWSMTRLCSSAHAPSPSHDSSSSSFSSSSLEAQSSLDC